MFRGVMLLLVGLMVGALVIIAWTTRTADAQNSAEVIVKKGLYDKNKIWKFRDPSNPYITVCWLSKGYDDEKILVKNTIAQQWTDASGIRFIGWEDCSAARSNIQIKLSEVRPEVKGLGRDINGKNPGMILNFTFSNYMTALCTKSKAARENCIRSIALHEFGHALALNHENRREDTSAECKARFAPQGGRGTTKVCSNDEVDSIMSYCNNEWLQNSRLSIRDRATVQFMYGFKPMEAKCSVTDLASSQRTNP